MSPGVPPRSSRVHRPSPGRIRRALRDATARPASYPHRTPPGRGGEVLTQQSNGGGDHVDRLNDEPWDAFGQAQDSSIISSTRVPALAKALSSLKHATNNQGGVNHGILWKDTMGRQIIFW